MNAIAAAQRRLPRRSTRGWRFWLAAYVLLAIAWPAAGPLPWVVLEHESVHHAGGTHDADHERSAPHAHGADDVPGSPTHPLDHDCAQCQVLKHLARCVPSDPVDASVPQPAGAALQTGTVAEDAHASVTVYRPPIRGPPVLSS